MLEVDSVFVVPTRRGSYVIEDLINSIKWSCQRSFHVIVVDLTGELSLQSTVDCSVIRSNSSVCSTFAGCAGVKAAVDRGIRSQQYVVLDDACLIIQPGIDTWALEHLSKTQVGLLGVVDRLNYEDAFSRCAVLFDEWDMPYHSFEPGPLSLSDAAIFLAAPVVLAMYHQGLLVPTTCVRWPLSVGVYLSWVVQMLGYYLVGWGHMDKPMPPLYVNHSGRSRFLPAPHILSPRFALYYSVRHVLGYSEEELRNAFKRVRGEPSELSEPFRPVVIPWSVGPTALG